MTTHVTTRPSPVTPANLVPCSATGSPQVGQSKRIGVLALQGAFSAHAERFAELGASVSEVRTPADLVGLDGLVMPGGESTTMSRLLVTSGLFDELKGLLADGFPVFGTCAGMILLATDVLDGRPDQVSFGAIDMTVRRNGYGRQVDSFETDLDDLGVRARRAAVPRRVHPRPDRGLGGARRRGARPPRRPGRPRPPRCGVRRLVPPRADG